MESWKTTIWLQKTSFDAQRQLQTSVYSHVNRCFGRLRQIISPTVAANILFRAGTTAGDSDRDLGVADRSTAMDQRTG